jgi:hypothetical protein
MIRSTSPWVGVTLDVFLTITLSLLGLSPVQDAVSEHRVPAALLLGGMHLVVVLLAFSIGLMRADDLGITREKTWIEKGTSGAFLGFYVLGWLMPISAFAATHSSRIPKALFLACIFVHPSPLVIGLVLALLKADDLVERFVAALSRPLGMAALGVLFAAYLMLVEAFLLLVRGSRGDLGPFAFPAWGLSYLPARLFFARLTGLRGPERYTFAASNAHLLVRLLVGGPS